MSTKLRRLAALCEGIRRGSAENGFVGHTFLQKFVYLLQAGRGINLGYQYRIYHYGPYCAEVWGDLNYLEDVGFITVEADPSGHGYHIMWNESESTTIMDNYLDKDTNAAIKELVTLLRPKSVRELECVATTHYIYRSLQRNTSLKPSTVEVSAAVRALKPHLLDNDVQSALLLLVNEKLLSEPNTNAPSI